jgi:hypothetical protein
MRCCRQGEGGGAECRRTSGKEAERWADFFFIKTRVVRERRRQGRLVDVGIGVGSGAVVVVSSGVVGKRTGEGGECGWVGGFSEARKKPRLTASV